MINSNYSLPGPSQTTLKLGNEFWFQGNHLIHGHTLGQFSNIQDRLNTTYPHMRMPRHFVHGPKNSCCTFGLLWTYQSPWQEVTCGECLEDSKAEVIQPIMPIPQFCLGIMILSFGSGSYSMTVAMEALHCLSLLPLVNGSCSLIVGKVIGLEVMNHCSPSLSLIWYLQRWDHRRFDGWIFVEIFVKEQNFTMSDDKKNTGSFFLDQVELIWWIAAVSKIVCICLTTAACICHEDLESDHLLVSFSAAERAMHVGGKGPKLHHQLLCDINVLDHLLSSSELCQSLFS